MLEKMIKEWGEKELLIEQIYTTQNGVNYSNNPPTKITARSKEFLFHDCHCSYPTKQNIVDFGEDFFTKKVFNNSTATYRVVK